MFALTEVNHLSAGFKEPVPETAPGQKLPFTLWNVLWPFAICAQKFINRLNAFISFLAIPNKSDCDSSSGKLQSGNTALRSPGNSSSSASHPAQGRPDKQEENPLDKCTEENSMAEA